MKKNFLFFIILVVLLLSVTALCACSGNNEIPVAGAPSAPQNFTATAGDWQIILTWTAPSDKGSSDIIKYEVSRDNGNTWVEAGLALTYTFIGLTNGTDYNFKVRAVNADGNGATASKSAAPAGESGDTVFPYGNGKAYISEYLNFYFSITYEVVSYSSGSLSAPFHISFIRSEYGCYESQLGEETDEAWIYIPEGEDMYHVYTKEEGTDFFWDSEMLVDMDDIENSAGHIFEVMRLYDQTYTNYPQHFKKTGTENILGRACDKYKYEGLGTDGAYSYTFWIDQATWVCLKNDFDGSASGSLSKGAKFKCVDFKIGSVALPYHTLQVF